MKDARDLTYMELADALENFFDKVEYNEYYLTMEDGVLAAAAGAIRRLEHLREIQTEALLFQRNRLDQMENEVNAVEWMNGRIEKELFERRKCT